jgi:hypothetical protein
MEDKTFKIYEKKTYNEKLDKFTQMQHESLNLPGNSLRCSNDKLSGRLTLGVRRKCLHNFSLNAIESQQLSQGLAIRNSR